MAAASAAEPLAEGVPPPLSPPAGGCWPSTWDGRGLSLQGLRIVAEQADGRSAAELWKEDWMRECAPPGWAAECIISDDRWVCDRLTCVATGDVWEKTAAAFNGCNAPAGCRAVIDARPELAAHIGRATHFVTYPWFMQFCDIVAAAARAVDGSEAAVFFVDRLCVPYHNAPDVQAEIKLCGEVIAATELVQVIKTWNDSKRMNSLWMMFEWCGAVAHGRDVTIVPPESQLREMTEILTQKGPDAILEIVFAAEIAPSAARTGDVHGNKTEDTAGYDDVLRNAVDAFVERVGGLRTMNMELADQNRQAYARAIDQEFERRWAAAEISEDRATRLLETCDLGHQLACLWALTSNLSRAEALFVAVIARLNEITASDGTPTKPADKHAAGKVARLDLTSAELVKLLKQNKRTEEAHTVQRQASPLGTLPVSWMGVSVEFLELFVEEHMSQIEFLSTVSPQMLFFKIVFRCISRAENRCLSFVTQSQDAVVERIIKPSTFSKLLFDPEPKGVALIETVHESHRGEPNFFLTHGEATLAPLFTAFPQPVPNFLRSCT